MTAKTLKQQYIDFIDWLDPYSQDEQPEDLSGMLYNLQEIYKSLDLDTNDRDEQKTIIKAQDLLLKFRDAGYQLSI